MGNCQSTFGVRRNREKQFVVFASSGRELIMVDFPSSAVVQHLVGHGKRAQVDFRTGDGLLHDMPQVGCDSVGYVHHGMNARSERQQAPFVQTGMRKVVSFNQIPHIFGPLESFQYSIESCG